MCHYLHTFFAKCSRISTKSQLEEKGWKGIAGRLCCYFWESNDNNYLDVYSFSSAKGYKFQSFLFGMTLSGSKFNWNVNFKITFRNPSSVLVSNNKVQFNVRYIDHEWQMVQLCQMNCHCARVLTEVHSSSHNSWTICTMHMEWFSTYANISPNPKFLRWSSWANT